MTFQMPSKSFIEIDVVDSVDHFSLLTAWRQLALRSHPRTQNIEGAVIAWYFIADATDQNVPLASIRRN